MRLEQDTLAQGQCLKVWKNNELQCNQIRLGKYLVQVTSNEITARELVPEGDAYKIQPSKVVLTLPKIDFEYDPRSYLENFTSLMIC